MASVLVLMTAMPPTLGHKLLIDFAYNFAKTMKLDSVEVLLCSRPQEPLAGVERFNALRNTYRFYSGPVEVNIHHYDKEIPQNPEDHPNFWNIWRNVIRGNTNNHPGDFLIASEDYGFAMAKALECEYVPCDPHREVIDIQATQVRRDLIRHFDVLLPAMRKRLMKTVTTFGQESTGKTTMARYLAKTLNGVYVPEWARPYLEMKEIGPEVTAKKMERIAASQYALQVAAHNSAFDRSLPFVFQDTDLLSTIGYYRLMGMEPPFEINTNVATAYSDLYLVMNDGIPFTPDILRYGGDKRESTRQFWIDLLEEFNFPYYVVEATDRDSQAIECADVASKLLLDMSHFVRT